MLFEFIAYIVGFITGVIFCSIWLFHNNKCGTIKLDNSIEIRFYLPLEELQTKDYIILKREGGNDAQ